MDYMTYTFNYGGVMLSVRADVADGGIKLSITADQGSVDLKALYFGDGDNVADFGGFSKKDASLNMNGEGSMYQGQHVAWDSAVKLADNPNVIGTATGDTDTFIAAGTSDSTYTIKLAGMTLDDMKFMGIRGQGGTADGMKAVAMGELHHVEAHNYFPALDTEIGKIAIVFDTPDPYFSDMVGINNTPPPPVLPGGDPGSFPPPPSWGPPDGYTVVEVQNLADFHIKDLDTVWDKILSSSAISNLMGDTLTNGTTKVVGVAINTTAQVGDAFHYEQFYAVNNNTNGDTHDTPPMPIDDNQFMSTGGYTPQPNPYFNVDHFIDGHNILS